MENWTWTQGKTEKKDQASDYTEDRMTDPELGLWGWVGGGWGGGDVRLQIRRWGSGGIKHAV